MVSQRTVSSSLPAQKRTGVSALPENKPGSVLTPEHLLHSQTKANHNNIPDRKPLGQDTHDNYRSDFVRFFFQTCPLACWQTFGFFLNFIAFAFIQLRGQTPTEYRRNQSTPERCLRWLTCEHYFQSDPDSDSRSGPGASDTASSASVVSTAIGFLSGRGRALTESLRRSSPRATSTVVN